MDRELNSNLLISGEEGLVFHTTHGIFRKRDVKPGLTKIPNVVIVDGMADLALWIKVNINTFLSKFDWSVSDLARSCDGVVPHNTVYRICRGENIASTEALIGIAKALGTTVDTLIKRPPKRKLDKVG